MRSLRTATRLVAPPTTQITTRTVARPQSATDRPINGSTDQASDRLTAELGPHSVGLVPCREAAPGVAALVADNVHHLGGAVRPAEAGPLPREAEAGPLRATRLLAAPVAHVDLALLLVGAAEL